MPVKSDRFSAFDEAVKKTETEPKATEVDRFAAFDEAVKKNKNQIDSGDGLEAGVLPSTISTIEPPKNAIDLSFDAFNLGNQKISKRTPATVGFGTGGGEVVTVEEDPQAKAASKKIKDDLKAQGYDADKLYDDFKDIDVELFKGEDVTFEKDKLLREYQVNPQQYEKDIALLKLTSFQRKAASELPAEQVANLQSIDVSPENTYEETRAKYKDITNRIKEYGGEYEKQLLKNFSVAVGENYGATLEDPSKVKQDERSKYLNEYQIAALQYLEDTNPDAAKGYGSMLVDPNLIKKGTAEEAGWQEKASSLEQIGLQLYKSHLESTLSNLANRDTAISPFNDKEMAYADELQAKIKDVNSKIGEINVKYPIPADKEAKEAAMDLTDNAMSTWYNRAFLSVGNAVDNTWKGVYDFVSEPFRNDEQSKLYQLATLGESVGKDIQMYLPKSKTALQNYDWQMSPEVSSEYKSIMDDKSLSNDDKTRKVYKLLQDNPDGFTRIPIVGGKTNITPTSLYYSVVDLGSSLVPYLALESLTAGGATAGIVRKIASSFMAAAATGLHDNYVTALREGAANPYKEALTTTAIMSAAMAGAGTPQMIKAMVNTKTAVGELVSKLTDAEIAKVLEKIKNGTLKNKILDYGKTLGKDAVKSITEGAKGGLKFESIMAGAKALKDKVTDKEINPEELFKEGAIGVLNFTAFGGVMGIGKSAWKGVSDFQGSTLLKASQNPNEYLKAAAKSLADGTITNKDYNQIRNNIELASKVSEGIRFIDDKGQELPENKKAKLLLAKLQEAKLNEDAQGDIPAKLKEDLDSQIADVKNEIGKIQESEEEAGFSEDLEKTVPELKATTDNLKAVIEAGGEDAGRAELDLALIKKDPVAYYEKLKEEYKKSTEGKDVPQEEIDATVKGYDDLINKIKETKAIKIPERPKEAGEPEQITKPIDLSLEPAKVGEEVPQAELPKQKEIEKLRTEEQAELDAKIPNAEQYRVDGKVDRAKLTNPEDIKAFDEVYNKYDKLITPLLKDKEVGSGVGDVYESNSELSKIGTKQEYADYLKTIFPGSQLKDVFYHRSNEKFDQFDNSKLNKETGGFFDFAKESGIERYGKNLYPALLNISKLGEGFELKDGQDGVKSTEMLADGKDVYSVPDASQIHILGNKADIEGFKNWKQELPATTKSKSEVKPIEVKEGDIVELPAQVKGGLPRTMIFSEGEWKQKVGDNITNVGENVKQQAQAQFESSQPQQKNVSVGEVKAEVPKKEKKGFIQIDKNVYSDGESNTYVVPTSSSEAAGSHIEIDKPTYDEWKKLDDVEKKRAEQIKNSNKSEGRKSTDLKANAMSFAAEKRKVLGTSTANELSKIESNVNKIQLGDNVNVNGIEYTVQGFPYGKIKLSTEGDNVKGEITVERNDNIIKKMAEEKKASAPKIEPKGTLITDIAKHLENKKAKEKTQVEVPKTEKKTKAQEVGEGLLSHLGVAPEGKEEESTGTEFQDGVKPQFKVDLNENLSAEETDNVKKIFDESLDNQNTSTSETVNIEATIDPSIPTQKITIDPTDNRPESGLMNKLRIPLNFIFGKSVGLGMSDTLTTGERTVDVMNPETGKIEKKTIREEGGIGYPFKSLMDLINGSVQKGKKVFGWASVGEGAGSAMINAAKKANKITGKELKQHYFDNLNLTEEQKQRINDAIPDNKEYGLVSIYKMGNDGILSNEAHTREAFRQIETSLNESEKELFFKLAKERLANLKWEGKEEYMNLINSANNFVELENILHGNDSKLPLGSKASIIQNVFLSTEKTVSTKTGNKLGELLKSKGISIESVSRAIEEPAMKGIDKGQPMVLLAIDPESKVIEDVNRERHKNYPYGVEGFPVGVFNETTQMHRISPEMMDNFVKTATTTVDEGAKKNGQNVRVSIYQAADGKFYAQEGKGVDKFSIKDKKGIDLSGASKEELLNKLKKEGYKLSKSALQERYTQKINGTTFNNLLQKAKTGFISIFSNPKLSAQEKLVKYLQKAFPGISVEINSSEYKKLEDDFRAQKLFNKDGKSYGFVKDGRIYLNPEYLNNNTPIHEFAHIWNSFAKNYKPEVYSKGVELVSGSKYHDFVLNDLQYQKLIKAEFGSDAIIKDKNTGKFIINENSENVKAIKDAVADEALAKAIGDKGELFVNEAQKRAFTEWLNKLYDAIKKVVGFESMTSEQFQNLNLNQFVDAAVKDILSGKKVSEITSAELSKITRPSAKFSLESQDAKIKNYIDSQRKAGVSEKDIKAGIESVADKLGLDSKKIDSLMKGEIKAEVPTSKVEPTPQPEVSEEKEKPTAPEGFITKEELSKYENAKKLFESEGKTTWNEVVDGAVQQLIKDNPNRTVEESAQNHANRLASLYNEGNAINPTAHDLAIINIAKLNIEKKISELEGWDSENGAERAAAMLEFDKLNADLLNVAKAANPREAGLAFNIRQMILSMGADGLKMRRMELSKKKGGESLSSADLDFTRREWAKEKELIEQKAELEKQALQEKFDAAIKEEQDKYQQLLQEKGNIEETKLNVKNRQEALKQKGKKFADKLRKGITKGTYSDPFLIGQSLNLIISKVADLVEGGFTLAAAIDKYVTDNKIQSRSKKIEDAIFDHLNRQDKRENAIELINKEIENTNATTITKDMVDNNSVKDFVDSYVNTVELNQVSDVAFKKLKELLPDLKKEDFKKAYLKDGQFKSQTSAKLKNEALNEKAKFNKLTSLENKLGELKKTGDLLKEGSAKKEEIEKEIKKVNDAIQKQLTSMGKKISSKSALAKSGYEKRANEHNKNIDEASNEITKYAKQHSLSDAQKQNIDDLLVALQDAKIKYDPNSKLDQTSNVETATEKIDLIQKKLDKLKKGLDKNLVFDIELELQKIKDRFESNKKDVDQSIMLEQAKKDAISKKKELERKLAAGEFDDTPVKKPLTKSDAELAKVNMDLQLVQSKYDKKAEEYKKENRTPGEVVLNTLRDMGVNTLIALPKTFAKLTFASPLKIAQTYFSKLTFGRIGEKAFNEGMVQLAKEGGESSSTLSANTGLKAVFKNANSKQLEVQAENNANKYIDAATEYENAFKNLETIKAKYGETSPEYKKENKKVEKLKAKSNRKLLISVGDTLYQYIGGSTLKTAMEKLQSRNTEYERSLGDFGSESWTKVRNWKHVADNISYVFSYIGRSHGALKSISARYHVAAGFMARLEAALAKGEDITDFNRLQEMAADSYTDWESGMYQQDNAVTTASNRVVQGWMASESKSIRVIGNLLNWDVAITRVPVNIINEAVIEMAVGLPLSVIKYKKELGKAKTIVKAEMPRFTPQEKSEYKKALAEEMSKMDKKTAVTIMRMFRHGGFGLGMLGLALAINAQYGGAHHKGQKKEDEKKGEDELKTGEISIGNEKLNKYFSAALEHTSGIYPFLAYQNISINYQKDMDKEKGVTISSADATAKQLENIVETYPQAKVINPIKIGEETYKTYKGAAQRAAKEYLGIDILKESTVFDSNLNEPGVKMLLDKGAALPKPPDVSKIEIDVDANHPKGKMTLNEGKEFSKIWKEIVVKKLNDLEKVIRDKKLELTPDELKEYVSIIHESATNETHIEMQFKRKRYKKRNIPTKREMLLKKEIMPKIKPFEDVKNINVVDSTTEE